jgi:predicted Zn-dependent protease with MMP-like domain
MRNPDRIPVVLKAIEKEWYKYPDWRFGQWFFNEVINEIGDPFFIEDEDLINLIQKNERNTTSKKGGGTGQI